MKHIYATFVLGALGLSACSETLDPRPDTGSFGKARQQAYPGTAAALLGNLSGGKLAVPARLGPVAAAKPPSGGASSSVVVPNAYTDMMGEQNNTFPHGFFNMRYQQVFLGPELQGLRAIGGLCLRRDEIAGGPTKTVQLTVKLGPTALNNLTLTPTFDANYSAPPTTVFSGAVHLPASTGGGTPDDFYICIDFTTTYIHPLRFNLIVEIANTTSTEGPGLHFDDACVGPVCTTRRIFAHTATAAAGVVDQVGLVMKLNRGNPSTADQCRKGGWKSFGFKNQGQCIRFVQTGKDSR